MANFPLKYDPLEELWRKIKLFLAITCVVVIVILYFWIGRGPRFQVVIFGDHFTVFHFLACAIASLFLLFMLAIDYLVNGDVIIQNDELIYYWKTFFLHIYKEKRVKVSEIASIERGIKQSLILRDKEYRELLIIPDYEEIRQELEKRIAETQTTSEVSAKE